MNGSGSSYEEMLFGGIGLRVPSELRYAFEPFSAERTSFGVNGEFHETRMFLEHTRTCRVFLDIGALFGFFSLLFARSSGGRALALEPSEKAVERGIEIARENGAGVEFLRAAAGAARGRLRMSRDGEHDHLTVDEAGSEEVELWSIDALAAERGFEPDAIKIDTEGYELEILKGGETYLRALRPTVFLELHLQWKYGNPTFHRYEIGELEEFVRSAGYRVINLFGEEIPSLARYASMMPAEHHRVVLIG